jgi:hypothetical protein
MKLLAMLALAALLRFLGLGAKQFGVDEIIQVIHSRPDSMQGILNAVTQDRGGADSKNTRWIQNYLYSSKSQLGRCQAE